MRHVKMIVILFAIFCSCKKSNESNISGGVLLVRTITSKTLKVDTSRQYYTVVNSFQYDTQKRVSKYIRIAYDTSLLYDVHGNLTLTPQVNESIATLNYIGSSSIPSNYTINGQKAILTANTAGKIITDSLSPANVTRYFYSAGLVIGQFGDRNSYHAIDSSLVDPNSNVTTAIIGGIYFPDSLNLLSYGRLASSKYLYGAILNPVFENTSASLIIFLFTNNFISKHIAERSEFIIYGPNAVVLSDEVVNFQNIVNANNVIQKSLNTSNAEYTAWEYY